MRMGSQKVADRRSWNLLLLLINKHKSFSSKMNKYLKEWQYNHIKIKSLTFIVLIFRRAEGLALEIKDLQGQLADYNMVKFYS